jgi:2',3'-cyclic-nucleotide 2'-phosphodiesterase/3'-nucleotidase
MKEMMDLMRKKFSLRIMSTNDVHGQILAVNYANNQKMNKGMSLLSSAVKKYRQENTILFDLGDALQGSPLMYFHQLNRKKYPNPYAKVMNYMDYDYFIPGNHDFNYGLDYLQDFVNEIKAKTLCANILKENQLLFKNPYDIIDFNGGPKIAVIGLTTQYIPNWENPAYIKGLVFQNAFSTLKELVNELRSRVDLVVVAYHGGFERDLITYEPFVPDTGENLGAKMLKEIEGIDCFLSSHQHRYINEVINDKAIIQGGSKADSLGLIDVDFTFEDDSWKVTEKRVRLIKAEDFQEDPDIVDLVNEVERDCQLFLDQKIGNVVSDNLGVKDMFKARVDKHPIVTFINKVQLEASKAMISATSLPNEVTGFEKAITVRNVLSTYVYANTLTVLELSGKQLKQILEKNAEYFVCDEGVLKPNPKFSYPKQQHYNYDMFDGINYTINVNKPFGMRIENLTYKENSVSDNEKFTLVVNSYRASGGGDFEEFKTLKKVREIPFDIAELIIDYIVKHRDLYITDAKNIKIKGENC